MMLTLAVFLLANAEIAPGVVLVPGPLQRDRSPDGNSVLLRGTEGWVVVDTGRGGEHTDELLRFLAGSGAEPRAVIDTHWHLDLCIEGWLRDSRAADSPYARELLDYYLKQFLLPDAPGRKRWCDR
jgi:glyoxylase-like metal-dependent hydrolase (beta-lactamase superfamily II)